MRNDDPISRIRCPTLADTSCKGRETLYTWNAFAFAAQELIDLRFTPLELRIKQGMIVAKCTTSTIVKFETDGVSSTGW